MKGLGLSRQHWVEQVGNLPDLQFENRNSFNDDGVGIK